jgi:hypothetical protein
MPLIKQLYFALCYDEYNITIASKLSIDNVSDGRYEFDKLSAIYSPYYKYVLFKYKANHNFYNIAQREDCYLIKDFATLFIIKKTDTASIKTQRRKLFEVLLDEGILCILEKTK